MIRFPYAEFNLYSYADVSLSLMLENPDGVQEVLTAIRLGYYDFDYDQ